MTFHVTINLDTAKNILADRYIVDTSEHDEQVRSEERKKFAEWIADTCSVWTEDYPFGMNAKALIYGYKHQKEGGKNV